MYGLHAVMIHIKQACLGTLDLFKYSQMRAITLRKLGVWGRGFHKQSQHKRCGHGYTVQLALTRVFVMRKAET